MNRIIKPIPIIFGIFILTIFLGFQFESMDFQTANAESQKRVVGYFPYWESGDIDSIDYSKLTNIIYFHIGPNSDGSLNTNSINTNDLNTIRDRAHANGVAVTISVGGWGASDGFPIMTEDPAARANFVSNIKDFILTYDLDGVDIDWETQINQAKINNQDVLLSELAESLHPLGKTVTTAVNGYSIDLKLNDSIDWVNIMAYDLNWNNAEHSTFAGGVASLQMYESLGFPKDKLVLGVPFYGRSDGWSSTMTYQQIIPTCNPLPTENYCNGHYFNGINLIQQKTQYVLDNNYGGVMIWNLGQDTYDQTSLLNSINEIFNQSGQSDVISPVITPLGTSKSIPFGSTYTELGATVTDNDSTYSGTVTITGTVNTSVPGTYTITYNAPADAAGNVPNEKSITITVLPDSTSSPTNSYKIAGWRSSQYGDNQSTGHDQSDPNYWISVAQQMTSKFPGFTPGGVLIIGEIYGAPGTATSTFLPFPKPAGSYPNVVFGSTDTIEPLLDAYDAAGLKVYLQVESAEADVPMLMNLIMDRYKHHPSVIGFGVDAEWYHEAQYPGWGRPLTNNEVNAWAAQVKTFDPNYSLMVKHWDKSYLSSARPDNVLFLTDSEQIGSLSAAINEYVDWIDHFGDSQVGFQIGYPSDMFWWSTLTDPAAEIMNPVLAARPDANVGGIFWVDFSVLAAFPDPQTPPTIDTIKPVITTLGTSKSIPFGSTYTELGATVTDNDPTYSGTVTITGTVNTSVPGTYTITYNAPADAAGNVPNEKSITITVLPDSPPTGPILFSDDFESGFAKWNENGEGDWKIETPDERQVPGHSSNLVAHSDNCDSTCTITMKNSIDLSTQSSATLSFWRYVDRSIDSGEYLRVQLYDGSSWNTVLNWTHGSGDDDKWHQETVNLDSYLGVNDFKVRFVTHQSSSLEAVEIDDVLIESQGYVVTPDLAVDPHFD